jgi:hypothetical protein
MKTARWRAIGAIVLLFTMIPALRTASAQTADTRSADLPSSSRTILGITLGESNLDNVQAKLGRARVWGDGDAGTAETKVCYLRNGTDSIALIFASNAEMAGSSQQVTDIRIVKRPAYKDSANCQRFDIAEEQVHTISGLRLGIDGGEIRRILGQPSESKNGQWNYDWSVDRPLPESDKNYEYWSARRQGCFEGKTPYYTIVSSITVRFERELVVEIAIRRIDSIC